MKVLKSHPGQTFPVLDHLSSVTIGNFDGCHRGHQKLLESAEDLAAKAGAKTTVLTFDPHPREYFSKTTHVPRLFQPEQKIRALTELGVDVTIIQNFDEAFCHLSPEEFAGDLLGGKLKTVAVTVGYDFRFGRGRAGRPEDFSQYIPDCQVKQIEEITIRGDKVSSSAIRQLLGEGEIARANQLLGRPYLIEGRIQRGRQLGRKLGFPTANLTSKDQMLPKTGVYGGWAVLEKDPAIFSMAATKVPCVMNIGYRPTVEQQDPQLLVEVHLLEGSYGADSLYDQPIGIYVEYFLRPEQKFASLDELKTQILKDSDAARQKLRASASAHK